MSNESFQPVFGASWSALPALFHKRYANRARSIDVVRCHGVMEVWSKAWLRPFLRLSRSVPPFSERNLAVSVDFISEPNSDAVWFHRSFQRAAHAPYFFNSRLEPIKDDLVCERLSFRICWLSRYRWQNEQVRLTHAGYALDLFGKRFPLPITWLLGRGDAYEQAIDEERFEMRATLTHKLWGLIYEYKGVFVLESVANRPNG